MPYSVRVRVRVRVKVKMDHPKNVLLYVSYVGSDNTLNDHHTISRSIISSAMYVFGWYVGWLLGVQRQVERANTVPPAGTSSTLPCMHN
jgi:hypothetical protein